MRRRALYVISGVCVLFTSLTHAHVLHHMFTLAWHEMSAAVTAGLILAAAAGVFSFVGAYLLLTGGRASKSDGSNLS